MNRQKTCGAEAAAAPKVPACSAAVTAAAQYLYSEDLGMPVSRRSFGHLKDGRNVDSLVLRDPRCDFSVELLEYGATIRAIRAPTAHGRSINAVLSYPLLSDYEDSNAYLGATIGRCAGRTASDGRLRLSCNEATNHLHGGAIGFSRALWQTIACEDGPEPKVRLRHRAADGDDGYPGELVVEAEFALLDACTLRVVFEASCTADTPLNMTLHPYFNLDGDEGGTVDEHRLRIAASQVLSLSHAHLPTGETLAVDGTPFDFRASRAIAAHGYDTHEQMGLCGGYDHYFIFDGATLGGSDGSMIELSSPASGLSLRIRTNQSGVQFYSGNQLSLTRPRGFCARGALCLEPHGFPNALNEPRFPEIMVRAGRCYRHETHYTFHHG